MNLNKKIGKFTEDGIPAYNQKINELIDAVNWLAGMRTINGNPVRESDQGPIFDLSQINSTQNKNPWAIDPNGNQAGWMKVAVLNPDPTCPITQIAGTQYIWTGPTIQLGSFNWCIDPNGNIAHWIVGAQGAVWGTGPYPGTPSTGNFQQAKTIYTGSTNPDGTQNYHSPAQWQSHPVNAPITVPANPPAFYVKTYNLPGGNAPALQIGSGASSIYPTDTINWTWTLTYEGTQVLSYSGSFTGTTNNSNYYAALDPTGWVYDPAGVPGYSQGSGNWLWQYQGAVSANTSPTIVQTFTFSSDSTFGSMTNLNVIFLTA